MKWFVKCWKQYADFSGRARRQEFWMFRLFHVLVIVFFLMLNNLLAFGSMASVALTERPESAGAVGILIGAVTALCVLYCLAARGAGSAGRRHLAAGAVLPGQPARCQPVGRQSQRVKVREA